LDVIEHEGKFIVLSGNQRLRALKELKTKEVPCNILRDDLEPETYRQIVLQANTNYGEHDDDLLANEWDAVELHEWGYDLPDWEAEKIEEETEGDDDVPVSAPAITVKGDLYTLGEHRLLCGDSTMIDDVEKLMDGQKADMVFTDPPYGINMAKGFEGSAGFSGVGKPIKRRQYENDKWDDKRPDHNCFELIMRYGKDSIIFGGNFFADILPQSKHWLVWNKNNTMPTFGDCELAWTSINRNSVKKYDYTYNGLIGKETERFHPTQKPIGLFLKIFNDYDFKFCFDPFLGSGSTLIACEKTNRKCYGMELDEKYCDVIVKRYIEFCVKNNKEAKVYRNGELISNDVFLVG
jgi:DNA modification methylase